jgi:hypothetical protein
MQQWLLVPSTMIYLAALDNHRSIVFKSIPLQFRTAYQPTPAIVIFRRITTLVHQSELAFRYFASPPRPTVLPLPCPFCADRTPLRPAIHKEFRNGISKSRGL